MKRTSRKSLVSALILVVVAVLSYAAGAAKGKTPVNWNASELKWDPYAPGTPLQVAKLWGDRLKPGEYGMLLKLPAGFEAGFHSHSADYEAVLVQGTWVHSNEGDPGPAKALTPGSYVFQPGKQNHNDVCESKIDCIMFIHQHAKGDFIPEKATEKAVAKPAAKAVERPTAKAAGKAVDKAVENAVDKTADPSGAVERSGAMPADRK